MAREKLEKEGMKRNKNQLVLRDWLKGGSMKLPDQGGNWGGKKQGKTKKEIWLKHEIAKVTERADNTTENMQDEGRSKGYLFKMVRKRTKVMSYPPCK